LKHNKFHFVQVQKLEKQIEEVSKKSHIIKTMKKTHSQCFKIVSFINEPRDESQTNC